MNEPVSPVSILGIGAITPLGRNLEQIHQKLALTPQTPVLRYSEEPDRMPEHPALRSTSEPAWEIASSPVCEIASPPASGIASSPAPEITSPPSSEIISAPASELAPLRVDDSLLSFDPAISAQMRRADRFTRMAVAAAIDASTAAKESCVGVLPERIGLFVCSGFGPHSRGFRFLDGILDAGDTAASPTDFSHSVHGVASAYISRLLDLRGPSLATTDFEIGFEEAVRVAQCWLNEGACDRILIGAVEELGEVYLDCASRMLSGIAGIRPGEGAVFLMLGRADIPGIARLSATASPASVDLLIIENPVILPATKPAAAIAAKRIASVNGSFGHCASSTAFNLLGALLAMRGLGRTTIDTAATLRTSSDGRSVTLLLEK